MAKVTSLKGSIQLILPLIVLFVSCLLVIGCGRKQHGGMPQRPPVPATTARAISQNVPLYIDEIGNCIALQNVSIVPQVSGIVTEIHFEDGKEVKKGDLLFTIDSRIYEAARDKAEATLQADEATLKLDQSQLERNQSLVEGNFISSQDLENLKTSVAIKEAAVKEDKANLKTAEINLEYCKITSPIDGKTGVHQVDIGNVETAYASTPMVSIQRLDPLYVDFVITEGELPQVRHYLQEGTLQVQVSFPEDETKNRMGDLFFFDNAVQNGTGTVKMRAILKNSDCLFWPGQFVKVRLILTEIPNAVVVPYSAVQIGHDGSFVFVVKEDNTVELRLVNLGQRQGDRIVIEKGVSNGDNVVLTGQLLLSPGAKIAPQLPSDAEAKTKEKSN